MAYLVTVSAVLTSLLCVGVSTAAGSSEFTQDQLDFFENRIRPVLAESCLDCHTGTKSKNGLELNHRAGWIDGSDYRKVVDLENPAESVVIKAVAHTGGADISPMPKKGNQISAEAIADLTAWIAAGLPWPEYETQDEELAPEEHWSFQPVVPPALPADAGHPIDWFIQKSQNEAGVQGAPKADRATLYRRAHFGIVGLPPSYAEQQKFVNDPRSDDEVWSELIDTLLASKHYGERWARLWMDVARYADTKGYEAGGRERRFVYSYTYRDWLIRAFNEDMSYDQFILYQLAAEKLVDWKGPEKEHLAAMGFLSLSKNGRNELVIDDRIDTTFRGMMALTVACARCHDHKFDPIPTADYYSIYSIFNNSRHPDSITIGEEKSGPEYEQYLAELAEKQKVVDDFLEPKLAVIAEENPNIANRRVQLIAKLERADRRELQNKERVVDKFVADAQMEPDKALILKDSEKLVGQAIFIRGSSARRGESVQRHFVTLGSESEPEIYKGGSGRLELARDIASAENPLTARNIVNRVWMWHFGEGIVRTIDDFGIQGEAPDHPELLDWLAHWFVENGWSIKKLHHLILTSETWQQSSSNEQAKKNRLVDAENRLLWQFNRKRLELEQMRDAILTVSDSLSEKQFGRPVKILEEPYSNRRSVYAFIDRQNLNPVFRNFDFSNPQETTGKRPSTTIPMQALFTLNSDFMQDQAEALAIATSADEDRVAALHRRVFAQPPSDSDRLLADSFVTAFQSELAEQPDKQTNTEWSYGYGAIDDKSGAVDFTPLPHWTGEAWQIGPERPVRDDPRSYLYADEGQTHPGYTSKQAAIYQWRAPADLTVAIRGVIQRPNVGKGNGVRVKLASSRDGLLVNKLMEPTQKTMPVERPRIRVEEGDALYFIVEPHEDNAAYDSVRWSPQVVDESGKWPKWGLAQSFSGPATPATAWGAYAQALLNTNRFLFVD